MAKGQVEATGARIDGIYFRHWRIGIPARLDGSGSIPAACCPKGAIPAINKHVPFVIRTSVFYSRDRFLQGNNVDSITCNVKYTDYSTHF
jgi:hypothetical protein